MSKILVSLISDQTLPNVQLIAEFGFIEQYWFVSTHAMERKGVREWIIRSCAIPAQKLNPAIIVNEHDFEEIEQRLSEMPFTDTDQLYVNITGGTKIMSIVALNFFKELGAQIFYITATKNEYIKVFPRAKQKNSAFVHKVSVAEYMQAYGFDIQNSGKPEQPVEVTEHVFSYFAPFFQPDTALVSPHNEVFPALQDCRKRKETSVQNVPGLAALLSDLNFATQKPGFVNKDEAVYLSGGWFEEYIYNRIQKELALDEGYIAMGMNVFKKGVPNEFDVVFTHNNKIYTIECKTSVYYTEEGKRRTTIGDYVYKSDSLQNEFGLYPITAIATLSALKDATGKVNTIAETHYKRAELNNIRILAYSEMCGGKSFRELLGMSGN